MRKKCSLLFIVLLCALQMCGISAYAAGDHVVIGLERISPYTLYIEDSRSDLTISSGQAQVSSHIMGRSDVTKVKIVARLQKYENGKWTTIKTYTKTSNSSFASLSETYSVTKGYTYRVSNTLTAYCGVAGVRNG